MQLVQLSLCPETPALWTFAIARRVESLGVFGEFLQPQICISEAR